MKAVLQRVTQAYVSVNDSTVGSIEHGLVLLLGVVEDDTQDDIDYITRKTLNLRIFDDDYGIMNKSILDINGNVLAISQFTLLASTKKGNRPSYMKAAKSAIAEPIYNQLCAHLSKNLGNDVAQGIFGADMKIHLCNNGPVTIIIDSKNRS